MLWHFIVANPFSQKNVQPSGNDNKTSLEKILFPPCNYYTEAPVEVLDTTFKAHRKDFS